MALTPGTHLGVYDIAAQIGEGGMGQVYRAIDTTLGRQVAIKILPEGFAHDAVRLARLRREARLLASLSHPNICVLYGVGEHKDQQFLVMEFLEGRSLADAIVAGGLPVATVIRYGIQIADALAHAHARGVIHRDLKPSNVMITSDGRAKVLDFGLATVLTGAQPEEATVSQVSFADQMPAGTVEYMAPEILQGGAADARSDVWALGVVLYKMATGSLPFSGRSVFDLTASIIRDPTPHGSGPLHAVTTGCLTKDPTHRYQGAAEVRAALESLASPAPISRVPRSRPQPHETTSPRPSIAVLPFINMSADPDQDYLCEGIMEEIINGLTKLPGLHVASRTSASRFKGGSSKIAEIRKRLKVNTVLEGSVRKSGNQLRITANLVNAENGYQLWSERFDREMRDVFAIQDEISGAIADMLKIQLAQTPDARLDPRTNDLIAYNFHLRGRFQVSKRTHGALAKAIEYFEQAAAADPGYAPAYAGIADAYCLLTIHAPHPPRELFPKAKTAALHAIALDEGLGPAHASLGFIHGTFDWDWKASEREFRRAIELNPGDSHARHWYAMDCLMPLGRLDDALAEMMRALELDPLSPAINTSLGALLHNRREYHRAIVQHQYAIELDPNFYFPWWTLGRTHEQLEEYDKAMDAYRQARLLAPGSHSVLTHMARCHAFTGRIDDARRLLDELVERKKRVFVPSTALALVHFSLGEHDRGFELLQTACEERTVWLIWCRVSPTYDDIRSDPRFAAILEQVGV